MTDPHPLHVVDWGFGAFGSSASRSDPAHSGNDLARFVVHFMRVGSRNHVSNVSAQTVATCLFVHANARRQLPGGSTSEETLPLQTTVHRVIAQLRRARCCQVQARCL